MMHECDSRSPPSKESRGINSHNRPTLLGLRNQGISSMAADRTALARRPPDQYEDQWEIHFLNHLARQIYDSEYDQRTNVRQRYGDHDEEGGRRKQVESRGNKNRKKDLSKYKAYAVKMKIPSYHELNKPRAKEGRSGQTVEFKYRSQLRGMYEAPSVSKMQEIFRVNVRDIVSANIFESNGNIFKKRPQKSSKNTNIRKRSIKTSDKRREDDQEAKISLNKFLKTSTSPKIPKKYAISLDQSSIDPCSTNHNQTLPKQPAIDLKKTETNKSKKGIGFVKNLMKSPQKQREKDSRQGARSREGNEACDSTLKLLEKVDKAIHFKKKDPKQQSPAKSPTKTAIRQAQNASDKLHEGTQLAQASKTAMRTIYTSKDVIRNKSNILKQTSKELDQPRKQQTNQKVFIFNSEDNYIRKMLARAGWIHNHDHRSNFYHLKWVFKPDAIDYNLKPSQFVNHVKNSHELTSKHYLNKNLKAYLSSWPNLYSRYPHSYDFSKPVEKQQFYAHFKKQIMMILLQNVYEYINSMRPLKVKSLTRYYRSFLDQNGTYSQSQIGDSPLRKKKFRKIDMEDYRQYDNAFLLHMNLIIIALKYWRKVRKAEELQEDDDVHFLTFKEKEFEDNIQNLQRYSKVSVSYSSTQGQQYFEREFYATPSDITIQRIIKEYVYFERQLGSQWEVFGRGNIWIVKPCSASRGTGIYLANDCGQILTDTRGIQSKIVQRYIERPLILRNGAVRGRKFDLRQWVLLKSVEPLEVYMFSHCYLRICSQDFDINNISNLKAHLTNYSFNKRHFQQPAESVIDQDTFQSLLFQEKNISFTDKIRPKIKQIIIQSIKSTQHLISDCGQSCFSLLGYDILIDSQCEPWLLQINMSPACEERTDWLRSYLDVMGRDLLKIVLPQDYVSTTINPVNRGSQLSTKKKWGHVQWETDLQLKKIKTQMSQNNVDSQELKEEQNYVNTIFDLNASKQQQEPQENEAHCEEYKSSQLGQRITYEQFLIENGSQKAESEEWEQVKYEYEGMASSPEKTDPLSPLKKQKFAGMELFLADSEQKKQASPTKQEALLPPPTSDNKLKASEMSLAQLQSALRWQKIYSQQYPIVKKDADSHLDIIGSKINTNKINQIDKIIDNAQEERDTIMKSCITLQKNIRKYLSLKRNNHNTTNEKPPLKLNVSRLTREQFRQSKSALYNHEDKSWCFERYSGRESGTYSRLDRPITARCSNPTSAKNKGGDSFREKIRSIAMQAASRQCKQIEQPLRQRPIEEENCSSHASLQHLQ